MKVLQINGVAKSGSTGKIVSGIATALRDRGHVALVAYSGNKENVADSHYYKIGSRMHTKWHQLLAYAFGDAGFHSSSETKKLIRYIKKEKPDLIHLHNIYSFYLNVDMLLSYLAESNIPVVWTVHDCWALTGKCTHFIFTGCQKWQQECRACPLKRDYPASLLLDRTTDLYRRKKKLYAGLAGKMTMVCVSNWVKSIVDQSLLKDFPNTVIYNGVDPQVFHPVQTQELRKAYDLEQKFVVLGVSNGWGKNKGFQDFLELAKLVDESVQIVLIGLSPEQIAMLPDNILGLPKTRDARELNLWYNAADVFVSFSKAETMGMVVAEAMSCGTPAVVMPTTASPELVDDATGFVNESATPAECCRHVRHIQQLGKQHYAENCIIRADALFSNEKNYAKYVDLYEKIWKEESV